MGWKKWMVLLSFLWGGAGAVAWAEEGDASHEHHHHEVSPSPGEGHEHHAQPTPSDVGTEAKAAAEARIAGTRNIGLNEKLGENIPLDLTFKDQDGKVVTLGSLLTVPTIIIPIFYHCTSACPMEMESVAKIVGAMDQAPGKDFRIVSVSFDPTESPEDAQTSRKNFLKISGDGFPPEAWTFLVGDEENVRRFLDSIGFRVHKVAPHNFAHPNSILTVSTQGKISRYLYGSVYLPFDVGLALSEASRGVSGLTARRLLTYCFTFDSAGNRYVLDVTKLSAAATLSVAAGFGLFLAFGKKRPRQRK